MHFSAILITLFLITWRQESYLVSGELYFKKGAPHVKLTNGGLLSGAVKFSREGRPFNAFLGIPFATVPERFLDPQPIKEASWEGVYSATKPGAICPQMPFFGMGEGILGEEDCLNLDVYIPMNNTGSGKIGYPVMVWVYGGGFMHGSGSENDPRFIMDEDVILVTFNYRVGAFGFLSTGDSVIPGNSGLKDSVVALKWVQENIRQFGGNPDSVTIFGESAGGIAVHYLMLSPTTNGLFHRAISQSGTALSMISYHPNPRQTAVELATYLKCPTTASEPSEITSEEIFTCLKGIPKDELTTAQMIFKQSWPPKMRSFFFGPTAEPRTSISSISPFLTEPPISILTRKENSLKQIPWMVGATEDEGAPMYAGVILSDPKLLQDINTNWESIAPSTLDYQRYVQNEEQKQVSKKLKQFYFGDKDISVETRKALRDIYSDELFIHGEYRSALETASRGESHPVYLYEYAYKGPLSLMSLCFTLPEEEAGKIGHGDDIQHLFYFGEDMDLIKPDTPDEEFSKNFIRLWTSFAINGEPTHSWGNSSMNKWKPILKKEWMRQDALKWFRIDANPETTEIPRSVYNRMKFWDDLWSEHITPAILNYYEHLNA